MKTPHKHAELIKAWADGAQIQYKSQMRPGLGWVDEQMPSFYVDYEWRIKPEPKPDAVIYAYSEKDWITLNVYRNEEHNLKLTFDGETGDLKSAEVLK